MTPAAAPALANRQKGQPGASRWAKFDPCLNYQRVRTRPGALNLAVARVLVCLYAAWKVATYPFPALAHFPPFLFLANPLAPQNHAFALPPALLGWVPAEQTAIVICLLLVALGWQTGLAAALGALLLAHLSGLNYLLVNERTFLLTVYFLILYALWRHDDPFRLDALLAARRATPFAGSPAPSPAVAGAPPRREHPHHALRLFQVAFALIYFFTGIAKLRGGGFSLAWASADNLRLILQHNALYHLHELPRAAAWMLDQNLLLAAAAGTTLALELGFLPALLLRAPITPFVVGLAGMHLAILATMHLNYFTDMVVFFAVFLPWDHWLGSALPRTASGAHRGA